MSEKDSQSLTPNLNVRKRQSIINTKSQCQKKTFNHKHQISMSEKPFNHYLIQQGKTFYIAIK